MFKEILLKTEPSIFLNFNFQISSLLKANSIWCPQLSSQLNWRDNTVTQFSRCFFFKTAAETNQWQTESVAENWHDLVKEMTSHSFVLDAKKCNPRRGDHWSTLDRETAHRTVSPGRSKAPGSEGTGSQKSSGPSLAAWQTQKGPHQNFVHTRFISWPRISI